MCSKCNCLQSKCKVNKNFAPFQIFPLKMRKIFACALSAPRGQVLKVLKVVKDFKVLNVLKVQMSVRSLKPLGALRTLTH